MKRSTTEARKKVRKIKRTKGSARADKKRRKVCGDTK